MSRFTLAAVGQLLIILPFAMVLDDFVTDKEAIAFSLIQVIGVAIIAHLLDDK